MGVGSDLSSPENAVRKTIRHLEQVGAELAEAFFSATKTTEVTVRNSEIFAENVMVDEGVGFRAVAKGNRVGFACTNLMNSEKDVLEAGEKALAIAKLSTPIPGFSLPSTRKITKVKALLDKRVNEARVEEAVDIARRMIEAAELKDERVTAKDGRVAFLSVHRSVVNSLGVDLEDQGTWAIAYLGGNGSRRGEVTPTCYDFDLRRNVKLQPEKIGKKVAEMVIAQFGAKAAESFEGPVIFGPEAVSYQLFDALASALSAEKVAANGTPWTGKIGESVASRTLTVSDNGVLEGGFASRSFDDEGYPSQKTVLISAGKLTSFLHNETTAKTLKMENTGNASRTSGSLDLAKQIIGNGYRAKPEVYPSNLVIDAGKKSQQELASELKKGVLVESMAGFVQSGSGLVSAQLARAHCIENGEIQMPLKGGMISGIAFDWFKQIVEVGNDAKQFVNSVVPSLSVEKTRIVGAR
jgi:PmbA protein